MTPPDAHASVPPSRHQAPNGQPHPVTGWLPRRTVIALLVVLAVVFVVTGVSTVYRAGFGEFERTDFTVYHAAGVAVMEGTNIYEAQNVRGWLYMYAPAFAAAVVPLALLPKTLAAGIFYVLSFAMLLHAAWVAARLAGRTVGRASVGSFGAGLVALFLTAWPWLSTLNRGQVSILLAWLSLVAIDRFARHRAGGVATAVGGAALAGAIVLKVFPALLVGWLVLRGRALAVAATLAGVVVLALPAPALVFGWGENLRLHEQWIREVILPVKQAQEGDIRFGQMADRRLVKNQSVEAVAVRLAAPVEEPGDDNPRETAARRVAMGINGGLFALTVAACWLGGRRARRRGGEDGLPVAVLQASAVLLLSLFVLPVTWSHYYIMALLPISVAVTCALGERPAGPWPRRYRLALAVWVVGFLGATYPPIYYAGGHLLAGLALWAAIVWHLLSAPAGLADDPVVPSQTSVPAPLPAR